jgi:hypothetical protein
MALPSEISAINTLTSSQSIISASIDMDIDIDINNVDLMSQGDSVEDGDFFMN